MGKAPTRKLKINTDGSFDKQSGKAGIRGVLTNDKGEFIMAFSIPIICGSNNVAELRAIKFGCEWCVNNRINSFMVEINSLVIHNILQNRTLHNYTLRKEIDDIVEILEHANASISYCYREANQVADCFAKNVTTSLEEIISSKFPKTPKVLSLWINGITVGYPSVTKPSKDSQHSSTGNSSPSRTGT
ncbi:uncharacterized protein LOC142181751 [Nicotiana tabacum]|uniref:Uncharacterized protein LOC142181751 n=1 Tax=Nicotiana tabacum TaxID=4097 RepID=A0AC58UPD8_TOBAC